MCAVMVGTWLGWMAGRPANKLGWGIIMAIAGESVSTACTAVLAGLWCPKWHYYGHWSLPRVSDGSG